MFQVKFNSAKDARIFQKELYKHYRNSHYRRYATRVRSLIKTNATRNQIYWILNDSKLNAKVALTKNY